MKSIMKSLIEKKVLPLAVVFSIFVQLFVGVMPAFADDTGFLPPSGNNNSGWVNPQFTYSTGNERAEADSSSDVVSYDGFNFSIPAGHVIDGIEVQVQGYRNDGRQAEVSLSWNNGVNYTTGAGVKTTNMPESGWLFNNEADRYFGNSTDKWGRSAWLVNDLSSDNFRVKLDATGGGGKLFVDYLAVKVYYSDAVAPSNPGTPTTTTPTTDHTPTWVWTPSTDNVGVDHYVFYWDDDSDVGQYSWNVGNDTTYTNIYLPSGTWYAKVVAYDAFGNSSASANGVVTIADRITSSATLNGASSVVVKPNTTITANVTGSIGGLGIFDWEGTAYRIATTAPGAMMCANTSDSNSTGTYSKSFTFDAPATEGVYNAYFSISGDDDCHHSNGTLLTMINAVTVDNTAPAITVPANITAEADQLGGKNVTFAASALDAIDGVTSVECSPLSGSLFPIGVTTVNCSSTDTAGNVAAGSFTVTVEDTTSPIITVPSDITVEVDVVGGKNVTFEVSAIDAVDGVRPVVCSMISGSLFPVGATTVDCFSKDVVGNISTKSFKVTITDTTAPIITLNGGSLVTLNTGETYTELGALTDDGTAVVIAGVVNTSVLGTYALTYDATDAFGNIATQVTRTVAVVDTKAPIITLNGATVVNLSVGTAYAELGATTNDGSAVVISGAVNTAAIGTYFVTYNSTDASGNTATPVTRTIIVNAVPAVLGITTNAATTGGTRTVAAETPTTTPETQPTPAVLGAQDKKEEGNVLGTEKVAVAATNSGWDILGLAWYWWLIILAIVASILWWIIAGYRRNREDQ